MNEPNVGVRHCYDLPVRCGSSWCDADIGKVHVGIGRHLQVLSPKPNDCCKDTANLGVVSSWASEASFGQIRRTWHPQYGHDRNIRLSSTLGATNLRYIEDDVPDLLLLKRKQKERGLCLHCTYRLRTDWKS